MLTGKATSAADPLSPEAPPEMEWNGMELLYSMHTLDSTDVKLEIFYRKKYFHS